MLVEKRENRLFIIERFFSCIIALAIVSFLEPAYVSQFFIVSSHAHFLLAYIYQARAGKIRLRYIAPFFAVVALGFYLSSVYPALFPFSVIALFMFHNFYDDFKLLGRAPHVAYLPIIAIISTVVLAWGSEHYWPITVAEPFVVASAICGAGVFLAALFLQRRAQLRIQPYAVFLFAMLVVLLGLEFFDMRPHYIRVIGFMILMHGTAWYIKLGHRFYYQGGGEFKKYVLYTLAVNAAFIMGLVYMYMSGFVGPVYDYVYSGNAFYVWTLMHLITTFRPSDVGNALRVPEFMKLSSPRQQAG